MDDEYERGYVRGKAWAVGAFTSQRQRLQQFRESIAGERTWERQFEQWGNLAWERFVAAISPDTNATVFWEARFPNEAHLKREIIWSQWLFVYGFADGALTAIEESE